MDFAVVSGQSVPRGIRDRLSTGIHEQTFPKITERKLRKIVEFPKRSARLGWTELLAGDFAEPFTEGADGPIGRGAADFGD
jgi:hypothetical protein